jgi:hypothetical protein
MTLRQLEIELFLSNLIDIELDFAAKWISKQKLKTRTRSIAQLAKEIMTQIFEYLSPDALAICSLACQDWHQILADNYLWKQVYFRKYQHYESQTLSKRLKRASSSQMILQKQISLAPWKKIYIKKYTIWLERSFYNEIGRIGRRGNAKSEQLTKKMDICAWILIPSMQYPSREVSQESFGI